MRCPRCEHENPSQARFCMACGAELSARVKRGKAEAVSVSRRKSPKSESPQVQDLEKRLTEALKREAEAQEQLQTRNRELVEALEELTATSEILRVISGSPTDFQPVFDTIVRNAANLCGAFDAILVLADGDEFVVRGHYGPIEAPLDERYPLQGTVGGRAIREARIIHIEDVSVAPDYPEARAVAQQGGYRTTLSVPLLREGTALGAITIRRTERLAFNDQQIALLKTFADQAVIAIENVRLFNETKEALDRQTATSEILRVISQSPTDAQPVFDTIVHNAVRLCSADHGNVFGFDGELLHLTATYNVLDEPLEQFKSSFPRPVSEAGGLRDVLGTGSVLRMDDVDEHDAPFSSAARSMFRALGVRSALAVPLSHRGRVVGAIALTDREANAFTDTHVELLKTFADQAVIAIENVRLFTELEKKNRALTEAHAQVTESLDRQTATSEILRTIAHAQTDVQPVFDTIVQSAARLCHAVVAGVFLTDGRMVYHPANYGSSPEALAEIRARFPQPLNMDSTPGMAILTHSVVHVPDTEERSVAEHVRQVGRVLGFRSAVTVPMLRESEAVGAIVVNRREPGRFSDAEAELLQTFADQAVIAIENVRLFNETKEALDRQTATSEILGVISSSPTDVQPVFDAIVRSAERLCSGQFSVLFLFDGEFVHFVAHHNLGPEALDEAKRIWPTRPVRASGTGRAILERRVIQIADIETDPEYGLQRLSRAVGHRSSIYVPMLRDGLPVGVIVVARVARGHFADNQVALLQTFADQAVIAIENVRLFKELQEKNRALTQAHAQVTESLERQTATSEILRVISSVHTDAQPVFDTIVQSAVRLCKATQAAVFVTDGKMLHHPANYGSSAEAMAAVRARYPQPITMESTPGITILTRSVVHVPDIEDPTAPESVRQVGRLVGFRSQVTVPMLWSGEAVGAILVCRPERGRFADAEVELLKTFSDQAVIAIENVRLFKELQERTRELSRSVEQLTALGEVGRAVSSTLDLETLLSTIVSRAVELSGLDGGVVFEYDDVAEEFVQRVATETTAALAEARRTTRIRKGEGVLGQTAITLEPVQVRDITIPGAYAGRLRENLIDSGVRAILAVPMVREGHLIGCLGVTRNRPGEFPADTIELLRTFATQSALAIQNARLFREIEQKSRELEAASRHKSEFLANMSHELRTPLNAIIGFSEVLGERMFGELNEKQDEYLKDIHASGQHLLSLINDILDLSKIEAGRMELEVTDFDLPMAVDNAMTLIRERAARRSIALHTTVDERLGQIQGDERKIRQVLLNLLSNAIKFTPERGRIEVGAKPVNGSIEVSVSDTGVGIAPEDQDAIFEEFKQVGTSDKKVEGTGLGLALSRKFIELHGGKIWVKSQVGEGSTFTFTIPVRRGE